MVEFGTGYFHPMDRDYGVSTPTEQSTNDVGVGIKDFGMSLAVGPVPNVQAIGAKLRGGMKTLEIGFTGAGKGSAQSQTPEYYGEKQRQALAEIAKANKVDFTTHASFGISGLAGMDQQGNFSRANKMFGVNEIKRAVEFAGDVAAGGPVVVHTGEFSRPVSDADWNKEDSEYKGKFRMFNEEEERASFKVVDRRTGGVIQEARKNRKVSRPVWLTAEDGEEYTDLSGEKKVADKGSKIYLDYFGKQVTSEERMAKFNTNKQEFETRQLGWEDLEEEAEDFTARARDAWKKWKKGEMSEKERKESQWSRFLTDETKSAKEIKIRPEEAYILATLETNAANSKGYALYYGGDFEEIVDNMKKLREASKYYEQMEGAIDPEEKWKLKQKAGALAGGLVPGDSQFPTEIIKEQLKQLERRLKYSRESAASQWAQAAEAKETMRNVQSAETYALEEAYDSYAIAGIHAMEQSNKIERKGKLKKPISVAMENLFPESYGSHPDEIIGLVKNSRKKMEHYLTKRGMSEAQAKKEAQEHITATIDTGHLNIWRKYWQGDKKTIEENDKDFDNWLIKKFEQMADEKIIGHIHLDDNYGYHDDHLAPGEGNMPIKEMILSLKKKGYKGEMIVEPGADWTTDLGGFHSVMKTWRLFGSPVYGAGAGSSARSWNQVGYGSFGNQQPPYFVFPPYSPAEDWTLWSGVPLE